MKIIYAIAVLAVVLTSGVQATEETLKAQMKARLPAITALKAQGIVGEDARGYLAFVTEKQASADVVQAENEDRRKVYEMIATRQGVTPEIVGQRRALQLAGLAKPGEWIRNASGEWARKP